MRPTSELLQELTLLLPGHGGEGPPELTSVSGGSVNHTWQVRLSRESRLFLKLSGNTSAEFYTKEMRGLRALQQLSGARVPKVFKTGSFDGQQYLAMEWISPGNRSHRFWSFFGETVAAIHACTNDRFGWEEDNFCGSMIQLNEYHDSWSRFFLHQRLLPQLELSKRNGLLDAAAEKGFQALFDRLDQLFNKEPPSLLHGDLWSGNFICDENDFPVLIDPAVYYGNRQMDLAMTNLFGGFHPAFYEAYTAVHPLPANHREQWDVCNLYPLLVHLNLFGLQYLPAILRTVRRYA